MTRYVTVIVVFLGCSLPACAQTVTLDLAIVGGFQVQCYGTWKDVPGNFDMKLEYYNGLAWIEKEFESVVLNTTKMTYDNLSGKLPMGTYNIRVKIIYMVGGQAKVIYSNPKNITVPVV